MVRVLVQRRNDSRQTLEPDAQFLLIVLFDRQLDRFTRFLVRRTVLARAHVLDGLLDKFGEQTDSDGDTDRR